VSPEAGSRGALQEAGVNVRVKLAALWTSVMFCYIYADYFGLYVPGALQSMLQGRMRPLGPVTQGMLVGTSLMLAVPGVMIFLSVALRPRLARALNIVFGVLYTLIILGTMWAWAFYIVYGVIEIALTSLVVTIAWRWPRVLSAADPPRP
jgi:uncharacterized protein DUF6326